MTNQNGPLQGLKIIDLTAVIMGPYATHILSDFGADVIKVEAPAGDIMRYVGKNGAEGMGPIHLNINRGKKLITLDLKKPEARDVLRTLIKGADAFVHNMRPKAIERLGFGYEDVKAIQEDIVYCGGYGYGEGGAYSDDPAYDDLIQGLCGVADLGKHLAGEPRFFPTLIADKVCGLTLAYSLLAALMYRARSGKGQQVEVPMFEAMVEFLMVEHLGNRTFGPNEDVGYSRVMSQLRRPHRTQDGFVCALPYHDKNWRDFFTIVGRPDLADDPRFNSQANRSANYEVLYAMLGDFIAEQTTDYWIRTLKASNIPVAPVVALEDLFENPHLKDVGLFQQIDHPSAGEITAIRPPIGFSATPARMGRPAGPVGADTVEVLLEAGYSQGDVDQLLAVAAVHQAK